MTDRKITWGQLGAVLLLALLPLGTELLPGRLAQVGAAAWLCPLLSGGALLGLGWLAVRRLPPGPRDWGERVAARWGRLPARVLAALFLGWGLCLAGAHAGRIGARLAEGLGASPVVLTGGLLLLAGWMAAGGLPPFARACEVFLLAVGAGFALILLFGIFRLDWSLTLLWTGEELAQVPAGALSAAGTLAAGGYALFLLGDVRPEPGAGGRALGRLGVLFALLAAAVLLVLGRLGSALAAQGARPFLQMVSGLGFEGAFQRLEGLVSALWALGDAALVGLLLLALGRLLACLLGREESKGRSWGLTGAVFLFSLPLGGWGAAAVVFPVGNLVAGGVLAGTFLAGGKKLEKSEK